MPSKPKDIAKFNEALYTLDDVMKELNIPYHLNSGSALVLIVKRLYSS